MVSAEEVLKRLKEEANPANLEGMSRYGMAIEKRFGASVPTMRKLAKELGKSHSLALELWNTGWAEAKMVAAMVDEPSRVTERQMDEWVMDFDSWDVCDQVCMNLFEKTPLAWKKIPEWSRREEEYVKRAAYALLACLAWHDKRAPDQNFTDLFPTIKSGAVDERNYVKKAVNWALRNIGKRNPSLNKAALALAAEILQMPSKAAKWIAADAIRELKSEAVQERLQGK
jgi:3-methyladenine DNA glycosylase AlkD